jgi:hypothetical protein
MIYIEQINLAGAPYQLPAISVVVDLDLERLSSASVEPTMDLQYNTRDLPLPSRHPPVVV